MIVFCRLLSAKLLNYSLFIIHYSFTGHPSTMLCMVPLFHCCQLRQHSCRTGDKTQNSPQDCFVLKPLRGVRGGFSPPPTAPCSLFPVPCSLFPVPWQRKTAANAAVFPCGGRPHLKISDMVSSRVLLPVELMLLQRITSWIPLRSTRPEMV